MKNIILAIIVFALIITSAAATAQEDRYPFFEADVYFHALLVHQENFRPSSGIFGSSMGHETGNFNDELDTDFDQVVESRFRFFTTTHLTKEVLAKFTLEVNPEYGHERGFGDFRVNNSGSGTGELRFKHFYIEVKHPVGGTLGYRVGRQSFSSPQSLIVGDPDAEGITFWYENKRAGKFTIAAAAADTSETREIEDIYSHFRYDAPKTSSGIGLALYGSSLVIRDRTAGAFNASPEINNGGGSAISSFLLGPSNADFASKSHAELFWAGFQLTRRDRNFGLEINCVASFGSLDPEPSQDPELIDLETDKLKTVFGYMGMLDAGYGRDYYKVGFAGAFVSGHDPDPTTDLYTGYIDVNGAFNFTRFFFAGSPYLVTAGFASPSVQGSGLIAGKFYAHFYPTHWMSINAQLAVLSSNYDRPEYSQDSVATFTKDGKTLIANDGRSFANTTYDSFAKGGGRYYGTEFDLWIDFEPTKRVHWLAEFDYFAPGSYFAGTGDDKYPGNGFLTSPDPAYRIATGFLFK